MADTEVEISITVGEGKYTFFSFKSDYRIYCWRYTEPWMVFTKGHKAISNLMYEYQDLENKMATHSMDNGVPDCPECGGKGMCDKHKLEYLKWEHEKALSAYEDEILKQERIKQNENIPD